MLRKAWSKHKLAHAVSIMTMDNRMTVQYTSIRVVLFVCLFVCLLLLLLYLCRRSWSNQMIFLISKNAFTRMHTCDAANDDMRTKRNFTNKIKAL